ncbi:MAG: hypothetical protein ACRD2Z_00225 [Thermoanaerobaculia bacterium]
MESSHPDGDPAQGARTGNERGRVVDLLAEGQTAFERGEYQAAIDAWSRIFLIEPEHQEAMRRIDEARRLQAEQDRQVEEIYHDALGRLDAGEVELARGGFERILALQPNHAAAREHLRRLEPAAGEWTASAARDRPPAAGRTAPARGDVAAAPGTEQETVHTSAKAAAPPRRRGAVGRAFVWIGGVVLLFAAAVAWMLYSQRQQLFPNARPAGEPAAATAAEPIADAERLQLAGHTARAIEMLERIPPESPSYAQAQTLIAQWQNGEDPILGSVERNLERHGSLLARAQDADAQGDILAAHRLLEEAAAIAPPTDDAAALQAAVSERLEPVADVLEMYRDGAWELALPRLWRIRDERPSDRIVERLLIDGYYNLAVRDLQRNAPDEALAKITQAVELDPEDPSLARVAAFARTYREHPLDLRYRLFVKYLPLR